MESSSSISSELYVIVRHVVYCIDVIISLLKCTYTKCLYAKINKDTRVKLYIIRQKCLRSV